jgi:hypothetical protein
MNKEKKLLKKLKQEAKILEPNLEAFMNLHFPKKPPSRWKAWLPAATLVASVLVFSIVILEAVPFLFPTTPSTNTSENLGTSTTNPSTTLPSSQPVLPPLPINSDQEAISIASITTATLFTQNTWFTPSNPPLSSGPLLRGNRPTLNFEDTMTLIKPYLTVFEQLLGTASAPQIVEAPSDLPDFTYVNRFTVYDIQGTAIQYQLYFNLTNLEVFEDESYYDLSGQLLINNAAPLTVTGSKTIEEDETTIRFRTAVDENNYIATRYKLEEDETTIRIQESVAGVVTTSEFKMELEDDETVVDLKFYEESDDRRIRDRFKFERAYEDGQAVLEIQYDVAADGERIKGKITVLIIEILDEFGQVTGYAYQAFQYNEDGEKEGEWQDDRRPPHRDDEEDEDEGDEDEDNEDDEDEDDEDEDDDA